MRLRLATTRAAARGARATRHPAPGASRRGKGEGGGGGQLVRAALCAARRRTLAQSAPPSKETSSATAAAPWPRGGVGQRRLSASPLRGATASTTAPAGPPKRHSVASSGSSSSPSLAARASGTVTPRASLAAAPNAGGAKKTKGSGADVSEPARSDSVPAPPKPVGDAEKGGEGVGETRARSCDARRAPSHEGWRTPRATRQMVPRRRHCGRRKVTASLLRARSARRLRPPLTRSLLCGRVRRSPARRCFRRGMRGPQCLLLRRRQASTRRPALAHCEKRDSFTYCFRPRKLLRAPQPQHLLRGRGMRRPALVRKCNM